MLSGIICAMSHPKISRSVIIFHILLLTAISAGCTKQPSETVPLTVTIDVPTSAPIEPTQTTEPMAVFVNGEGISLAEFDEEKQRFQNGSTKAGITLPDEVEQKQRILDELIGQLLLKQGAVEAGYQVSPDEVKARLDKLIQDIGGPEKLTAWEQDNYYSDQVFKTAFTRSIYAAWMRDRIISAVPDAAEQVHALQIRVLSESEAQGIIAQLGTGSDFATLAQQYDPVTKGDLGWFPRGYLTQVAVDEAAFNLEPGGISPVIKSDVGYHILQVIEKDSMYKLTPDAFKFVQTQALIKWLEDKRSNSEIIIPQ